MDDPRLPIELWERIIDVGACINRDDGTVVDYPTLRACALVCTAWLPRARYNIFYRVVLRTSAHVQRFISTAPATGCHVREIELGPPRWEAMEGWCCREPQIANVFFEPLVLDALQRHPHGHWCHVLPLGGGAIGDRTGTQAADLDFRLGPGLVLERIVDKALFRPADNRVYVPLPGVLPGISAIVVSEDGARATMLQLDLAIQPKHSSMLWEYKRVISKRVICEAIDMFMFPAPAERAREMKWSILLPTTKDQRRNVKLVGDLTLPEGYPAVDVGWMRVGGSWELLEVLHLLAQHDRDDLQIDA
ncbi:hypothetical protein L227DRAFT_608273 [Lentinus tigrinus ALCF2SS1-6]|uniref:F-box domain-containing protein n=1 Tax=Lentinus tigrinus ALCF2SS1-6 TaxID=1328759 RepID=A0A5C2SKB7_9APHY|nr:hypothetical protein L227DRAFT_608273 [Lentinus tigrinus ALCF2SS1-6]